MPQDSSLAGEDTEVKTFVLDTNILLYAVNASVPEHAAARRFLDDRLRDSDTVISELVLVELYVLLRTPAVVARPLAAREAAERARARDGHRLPSVAASVDKRGTEHSGT